MRLLKAIFFMLAVLHGAMLWMGGANVITMLLFYSLAAWLGLRAVNYFSGRLMSHTAAANLRTVIIASTAALVAAELFLRYVKQDYKSYTELNGSFNHVSEKIQRRALSVLNHVIPNTESSWFHTNDPLRKVDYRKPEFSVSNEYYNSLGLREAELSGFAGYSGNLIVGLGDSFTEGVGATFDSAWLKQLERILTDRGFRIKTLNAGVQGSDPLFGYMLLKYKLADLNPRLVIVAINNSDVYDVISMGGWDRFQNNFLVKYHPPEWWEYFYSFSFIVRNIVHGMLGMDRQFLTKEQKEAEEKKAKAEIIRCIQKFRDYSLEKNFNLLIVFHPMAYEIQNHAFELADMCRQTDTLSVPCLDLYAWYIMHGINEKNVYEYYWKTDLHHNAKGYGLWAQAVAEKIVSEGLMD